MIVPVKKEFYVYTFAYPLIMGNGVFYVGKGSNARIEEHYAEARSACSCTKCKIIRGIWKQGQEVDARIIYTTTVERDALVYEWGMITQTFATASLINDKYNPYTQVKEKQKRVAFLLKHSLYISEFIPVMQEYVDTPTEDIVHGKVELEAFRYLNLR